MPRRVGIELAPAERVEPGQERRFAAKRVQLADGLADRRLGDFGRRVAIAVEPRKRKAVERGIGGVEEPLERRLVPLKHSPHELEIGVAHAIDAQNLTRRPAVGIRSSSV